MYVRMRTISADTTEIQTPEAELSRGSEDVLVTAVHHLGEEMSGRRDSLDSITVSSNFAASHCCIFSI